MAKYILLDGKPLYPVSDSEYVINYNADGFLLLEDGTIVPDLNIGNSNLVDITATFPEDFAAGKYALVDDEFVSV